MSFLIAVHVNEGIVLASDRRTTYTNTQTCGDTIIQRIGIHTTNSTDKTFPCPNGAGISTCGDASLLGKPITGFIQDCRTGYGFGIFYRSTDFGQKNQRSHPGIFGIRTNEVWKRNRLRI